MAGRHVWAAHLERLPAPIHPPPSRAQYLDQNPIQPELLPPEVALLPALRRLYVANPAQAAAALQASAQGGPGGPGGGQGGGAAVAAGLIGQSVPFT